MAIVPVYVPELKLSLCTLAVSEAVPPESNGAEAGSILSQPELSGLAFQVPVVPPQLLNVVDCGLGLLPTELAKLRNDGLGEVIHAAKALAVAVLAVAVPATAVLVP